MWHVNKLPVRGVLRAAMAGRRKRNFTEAEIGVLVGEVEARKGILFGGHSSGVTNKRKTTEWQHVVAAVNSASATERPGTVAAGPAVPSTSASRAHGAPRSGRVLTGAVLQTQRDTIGAINEVRNELRQLNRAMNNICVVLSDIASSIKEIAKK